jgi:hypothetical protein
VGIEDGRMNKKMREGNENNRKTKSKYRRSWHEVDIME